MQPFHTLVSLAIFCISPLPAAAQELTNAEAIEVIEKAWSSGSMDSLEVGSFTVVRGSSNFKEHKMSEEHLRLYEALEDLGIVNIAVLKDRTKEFTGWSDWNKLTQSGEILDIRVLATDTAYSLSAKVEKIDKREFLWFEWEVYDVVKIVRNEPLERGAGTYRIVYGLHNVRYPLDFVPKYLETIGAQLAGVRDRKFRALLEYDYFDDEWKLRTSDIAARDAEFEGDAAYNYFKNLE